MVDDCCTKITVNLCQCQHPEVWNIWNRVANNNRHVCEERLNV